MRPSRRRASAGASAPVSLSTQALVELAYAEVEAFADALSDDIAIIALRQDGAFVNADGDLAR